MEKPILLVDVDGVLNAFGFSRIHYPEFEDVWDHGAFRIHVPAGTRDRMQRLAEVYDLVWATAWEDKAAPEWGPRLGVMGDSPHIAWRYGSVMDQTWKLRDVEAWCEANAGDRPVAWIDDDLHEDASRWAKKHGYHLVRTNPTHGMTDGDFRSLMLYAAKEVRV